MASAHLRLALAGHGIQGDRSVEILVALADELEERGNLDVNQALETWGAAHVLLHAIGEGWPSEQDVEAAKVLVRAGVQIVCVNTYPHEDDEEMLCHDYEIVIPETILALMQQHRAGRAPHGT
jgi:hypothetical protein